MSDITLPHVLPPAEDLSPHQARDLATAVQTAIGSGTVRETLQMDGYLDRLQVAAQLPSQAQRDAARQAMPAAASSAPIGQGVQAQKPVETARRLRQ